MLNCTCDDWKDCAHQIFAAQELAWLNGWEYEGKVFKFCPWCGKELFKALTQNSDNRETDD